MPAKKARWSTLRPTQEAQPSFHSLKASPRKWWIEAEDSSLNTQGWHGDSQGLVIEVGRQRRVLFFTLRRVYMQIYY